MKYRFPTQRSSLLKKVNAQLFPIKKLDYRDQLRISIMALFFVENGNDFLYSFSPAIIVILQYLVNLVNLDEIRDVSFIAYYPRVEVCFHVVSVRNSGDNSACCVL
jgi:hypothetical protein